MSPTSIMTPRPDADQTNPRHDVRTPRRQLDVRARYRGCLLGLAVGDALGTTLEFRPPGALEPIDDMVGGGPFRPRACTTHAYAAH